MNNTSEEVQESLFQLDSWTIMTGALAVLDAILVIFYILGA